MFIILIAINIEESLGTDWTFYPPLSDIISHSSIAISLSIFSLHLLGFSSEGNSINFIESSVLINLMFSLINGLTIYFFICLLIYKLH